MATRYATATEVASDKSRLEIERTLTRYGADRFMYASEPGRAMIQFEAHGRRVRFILPLPNPMEERFLYRMRSGRATASRRTDADRAAVYEQATRQVWRALALVVKAKLEAVESAISEFESEFLSNIVVPGTQETVGEWMRPHLANAYESGAPMPLMLPGGKRRA